MATPEHWTIWGEGCSQLLSISEFWFTWIKKTPKRNSLKKVILAYVWVGERRGKVFCCWSGQNISKLDLDNTQFDQDGLNESFNHFHEQSLYASATWSWILDIYDA